MTVNEDDNNYKYSRNKYRRLLLVVHKENGSRHTRLKDTSSELHIQW
jgi:hypothetical protein